MKELKGPANDSRPQTQTTTSESSFERFGLTSENQGKCFVKGVAMNLTEIDGMVRLQSEGSENGQYVGWLSEANSQSFANRRFQCDFKLKWGRNNGFDSWWKPGLLVFGEIYDRFVKNEKEEKDEYGYETWSFSGTVPPKNTKDNTGEGVFLYFNGGPVDVTFRQFDLFFEIKT